MTKVWRRRLYGTIEIADRLGVTRQRAYVITRSRDFPLPHDELSVGPIWLARDVDRWVAEHRQEVTAEDPEGS